MTAPDPLEAAYREMVAQTMQPCRELSLGERLAKRKADAERQEVIVSQPVDSPGENVDRVAS